MILARGRGSPTCRRSAAQQSQKLRLRFIGCADLAAASRQIAGKPGSHALRAEADRGQVPTPSGQKRIAVRFPRLRGRSVSQSNPHALRAAADPSQVPQPFGYKPRVDGRGLLILARGRGSLTCRRSAAQQSQKRRLRFIGCADFAAASRQIAGKPGSHALRAEADRSQVPTPSGHKRIAVKLPSPPGRSGWPGSSAVTHSAKAAECWRLSGHATIIDRMILPNVSIARSEVSLHGLP